MVLDWTEYGLPEFCGGGHEGRRRYARQDVHGRPHRLPTDEEHHSLQQHYRQDSRDSEPQGRLQQYAELRDDPADRSAGE